MAKIKENDVQMINFLLNTTYLPDEVISDYDMVTFKNGRGRYAPKSELLVVRSFAKLQAIGASRLKYTTFRVIRETLCNEIESLIKQ